MLNSTSEIFLLKRRCLVLKSVAAVSLFLGSFSFIIDLLNLLGIIKTLPDLTARLGYLAISLLCITVSLVSYFLASRGRAATIRLGSYIIIITWTAIIFVLSLVFPGSSGFILPMLGVGLLLSAREIIGWTLVLAGLTILGQVLVFTKALPIPLPPGTTFVGGVLSALMPLLLIGASFWFLQINARVIVGEVNRQLLELARLSEDREQKRRLGLEVGQNMRQQALELSGVSLQQESGATAQALAVMELTETMEHLGGGAQYVAQSSSEAAEMAERTRLSAQNVKETAEQAAQTTHEGLESTAGAAAAISRVQEQIGGLEKQLAELVAQSGQISGIVDLMRELADQTHLLALNAAIESAGAGQYGLRFGVVAEEVKRLADRSLLATREVQQMISGLQTAVNAANQVTLEARRESEGAAQRARHSGDVINELGRVIELNSAHAHEILNETRKVSDLMTNIADITGTQRGNIDLVASILRSIGAVAHENAGATRQLNEAATRLEVLSGELTNALTEAEKIVQLNSQAQALAA